VSWTEDPRLPPKDLAGPLEIPASSDIVFHSPQVSQRPAHLVVTLPHAEHEKEGDFAMPPCGAGTRRAQPLLAANPLVGRSFSRHSRVRPCRNENWMHLVAQAREVAKLSVL